jgi:hypothetical protein
MGCIWHAVLTVCGFSSILRYREWAFLEFGKLLYLTSCSGAASVPGLPTAPRLQGNFSKLHNRIQPSAPNYKFWKTLLKEKSLGEE